MENLKSTAMIDEWRNYLRIANTDVFEIIRKAITIAATDHPEKFQTKRDNIAEMLYSFNRENLDETEKVSKVFKIKRIRPETEDETNITEIFPKSHVTTENKVNIVGDTKVYRQGLAEVLRIKKILEKNGTHESVICDWLTKLQDMGLSINTLQTTGIGKTIRAFEKHGSKDVSLTAKTLIKRWKAMVNDYWINHESSTVKPVSEQGKPMNLNTERKSKDNFEKANRSKVPKTPIQQCKEMVTIQHKLEETTRKEPIVTEASLTAQRQKRLNSQNMDGVNKQSSVVRPNNPPVASLETVINPMKSTIPRNLEEQKLEATKRKLREGYDRADNMKRSRKTQVIEVHELLTQGLVPKHQNNKFARSNFSRLTASLIS